MGPCTKSRGKCHEFTIVNGVQPRIPPCEWQAALEDCEFALMRGNFPHHAIHDGEFAASSASFRARRRLPPPRTPRLPTLQYGGIGNHGNPCAGRASPLRGEGARVRRWWPSPNRLQARGMKAIRLDVRKGNEPARRIYVRAGFEYIDTLQVHYESTGFVDFELFEFALEPSASRSEGASFAARGIPNGPGPNSRRIAHPPPGERAIPPRSPSSPSRARERPPSRLPAR